MRERRSAERTPARGENLIPKKKYFLVFEGAKTEEIYFNAFKDKYLYNKLVDIIPLIRGYSETGFSNPEKMFEMIQCNLEEQKSQNFSYQTLIDWIIGYFAVNKILSMREKDIKDTLEKICRYILNVKLEDTVNSTKLRQEINRILNFLNQYISIRWKINAQEIADSIISSGKIEYTEGFDQIIIIADRDKGSFTTQQYEKLINDCNRKNIKLCITNPCFEFWLLMHFDAVRTIDQGKMLQNPKITDEVTYCHDVLRQNFNGYHKNSYNAALLMPKLKNAIENEKLFCEDIIGLKTKLGSNLGSLIMELGLNFHKLKLQV